MDACSKPYCRRRFSIAAAGALAAACSSSTTTGPSTVTAGTGSVTGVYSGDITNGQSTCPGNWQAGQAAEVSLDAVQSGDAVSLDVTGGAGLYVQLALGASTFNGTVNGSEVIATLHGTTSQTDGDCMYTWAATFAAQLAGDTLTGTVSYVPVTNSGTDCTAHQITNCSEVQSFTGVRPPSGATPDAGVSLTPHASVL